MSKTSEYLRLAAIGDGLIGPLIYTGRSKAGLERLFVDNRFINWLRLILPAADLPEDAAFGVPGETTVSVLARAHAVLKLEPLPHAVLICAGAEDAKAAVKGVAPTPEETVSSLEGLAAVFIAAGIKPIFIAPPPSVMFPNGLFADRFIAICATLRRLSGEDERIGLVDATDILIKPRSFGIDPDPRYFAASAEGWLSSLGAFHLAGAVAMQLRDTFPQAVGYRSPLDSASALNKNSSLTGSGGTIRGNVISGRCANGYSIDAHQTGGAQISAMTRSWRQRRVAQRLTFSGCYTTDWGFVRLCQDVAKYADGLSAGDRIEAICDFELTAPTANIASVSLHMAAVWDTDFIGLHSRKYIGGAGVTEAHGGRLRTPVFTLPSNLKGLQIAVQAHLLPGANLEVCGELDIHSVVLRKVECARRDIDTVAQSEHKAVVQSGRQA